MRRFYFDCETTGLDCKKNGIISIGYIIEDGTRSSEGLLEMKPPVGIIIEPKALQVNGYTEEQINKLPAELEQLHKLCDLLRQGYGRYDVVGYNVQFDMGFLREAFKRCHIEDYLSAFNYKPIDVFSIVRGLDEICNWNLPNHKLGTICKFLNIPLIAHNALEDIKATKRIMDVLKGKIKYERC